MADLRQSGRVRGLPPNFIRSSGENPMEAIDQGAATTSQVGDNVVVESGVPYSTHSPPLVQQPSWGDSSFHSPMEGRVDDTARPNFSPNASFWETPIGRAIASFGTYGIFSELKKNVGNTILPFSVRRRSIGR